VNCVLCPGEPRPATTGHVCDPCRLPLPGILDDIATLHGQLDLRPATGSAGPRVSGSRDAPLPLNVDALDLGASARVNGVHDDHGDQIGYPAVASLLDQWVRDWRDMRLAECRERLPGTSVPQLASWLRGRLDWACDHHPAIDEFVAEMRSLRMILRSACGLTEPRPERLVTPCSYCAQLTLVRVHGDHDRPIRCRACERRWTEEQYAEWAGELAYAVTVPAAA
jgi:hypothetical protein